MKSKFGNVNNTYILKDEVVQELNPRFSVPSMEVTNKLIGLVRKNGIIWNN
jgi:hypothetical protein